MDNIGDSDTFYQQDGNDDWWRKSTAAVHPTADDGTPVVTSVRRERLSRLGAAAPAPYSRVLTAESRAADIRGSVTASTTYVDRATKTVTHVTDVPTSTADSVSTTVNGLTVSSSSVTSLVDPLPLRRSGPAHRRHRPAHLDL